MFEKRIKLKLVAGDHLVKGKEVVIIAGKSKGQVTLATGFKRIKANVTDFNWENSQSRSGGKAAAGAIAGGLLTGGLGAIAGAAIGGRKKDSSTAAISFLDEKEQRHVIYVKCSPKDYEQLSSFL